MDLEFYFEKRVDALDAELLNGEITQEDYDLEMHSLNEFMIKAEYEQDIREGLLFR